MPCHKLKVVLDTNILVSACWKPGGLEARTVELAASGAFELCVSAEIVIEYRDVLARKKLTALQERAAKMLATLECVWVVHQPIRQIALCRDEDDNRFLECACAAGADYLVTGNLRHYPEICGATSVVNARTFLTACFDLEPDRMDR